MFPVYRLEKEKEKKKKCPYRQKKRRICLLMLRISDGHILVYIFYILNPIAYLRVSKSVPFKFFPISLFYSSSLLSCYRDVLDKCVFRLEPYIAV